LPGESFSISRLGHAEIRVTDLQRARWFFVDILGFFETEAGPDRIYLRGAEDRYHHSLVLKKAESPGLAHIGYAVDDPKDLDRLTELFSSKGIQVKKVRAGEEKGQGEAIRLQDPLGFPVEFYHSMDEVERRIQSFHLQRGANPLRIDHVNLMTDDVKKGYDYYKDELGFNVSEYVVNPDESLWGAWMHRKQTSHDVALMTGPGPRVHHVAFWMGDILSVIRACDVLASADLADKLERGPGRHGLSNAFFLYFRDLDGNRIEAFTGDYIVPNRDWRPLKWYNNTRKWSNFWGHEPKPSFYQEAMLVESVSDGRLMEEVRGAPAKMPTAAH
jgi:catechol 2,3-dioxygenase